MPRPARAFTAESFELEGRLLLAARFPTTSTAPPPPPPPPVQFESAASSTDLLGGPIQVVTQEAGEATVMLSRTDTAGSLQVQVTEYSSSPNVVGVNVGAGFDLRLMSWGDGTGVPTSGNSLVIVGTDTAGLLHIRNFDAYGNRVTDTDETQLPATQAGGISALKQQLPGLLPPHMLTSAEEAQILQEVTSIVGHTLGAGAQTVTFADGQSHATLTVPILAGAPNPGVVDVTLSINPNPMPLVSPPIASLDLKIVASDPTAPPKVVFMAATNQGLLLGFNKPMNPVGASNVHNYAVTMVSFAQNYNLGPVVGLFTGGTHTTVYADPVRLKSAQYDPATQSVTLIPKRPNLNLGGLFMSLTQGHTARTSVRRGHRSNNAKSITDLQGNPINASRTPGKVAIHDTYHSPV